MNQQETTRINTSLTRINTSPIRVNTNQLESDTSQHESKYQILLFYSVYFIKQCVIVTSNNYCVPDGHFIKSSILKPITES